jgi:hypothetical protein
VIRTEAPMKPVDNSRSSCQPHMQQSLPPAALNNRPGTSVSGATRSKHLAERRNNASVET